MFLSSITCTQHTDQSAESGAGPDAHRVALAHLANVLTERRVSDHLAQEVEVRRHQGQDAAAVQHGQVLLIGQNHVLQTTDIGTTFTNTGQETAIY